MADAKKDQTTVTKEDGDEKAMTKKKLHENMRADYQRGMPVDKILEKYGDDYPLKKSQVIDIVYPDSDEQKQSMVETYRGLGD